ncbi:MAG: hypothetical protein BGO69_08880 [Bacteroidetes bacterium 46-16]|nr:MAG: hypothetical protein BGO69_08880 [Bacteroidetes bacterium 46-16]
MKKIILLSAFVTVALGASAQIPNASFESWSTVSGYSVPDNWGTLNPMTTTASVYTAEKGTPGVAGSSYLKLTSKNVTGMGVMPGIAATGTINMTTMNVTGGFPYTVRSSNLTGSWQYMAMSGSDQGFIAVYLTKWDMAMMMRDTIAKAVKPLAGMAMSWAPFTIPLTYTSGDTPDSALVILSSSGMTPADGSYLWVDNLAFSGTTTGISTIEAALENLAVYPNPAKEKAILHFNAKEAANYTLQITDMASRIIQVNTFKAISGNNDIGIDTHTLPQGTYLVNIQDGTGGTALKLEIQ